MVASIPPTLETTGTLPAGHRWMDWLVRLHHPYRTTTGRIVYAPRVIVSCATVAHLRRLDRARGHVS